MEPMRKKREVDPSPWVIIFQRIRWQIIGHSSITIDEGWNDLLPLQQRLNWPCNDDRALGSVMQREGRGEDGGGRARGKRSRGAEEDDIHSTLNNPQDNKSCLSEICVYTWPNSLKMAATLHQKEGKQLFVLLKLETLWVCGLGAAVSVCLLPPRFPLYVSLCLSYTLPVLLTSSVSASDDLSSHRQPWAASPPSLL